MVAAVVTKRSTSRQRSGATQEVAIGEHVCGSAAPVPLCKLFRPGRAVDARTSTAQHRLEGPGGTYSSVPSGTAPETRIVVDFKSARELAVL